MYILREGIDSSEGQTLEDYKQIPLYRLTHIDNIAHIIENGVTHRNSPNANPDYVLINDSSIKYSRNIFQVSKKQELGDYTPFYFGKRIPMLYEIQNGLHSVHKIHAKDIVYMRTTVGNVIENHLEFVFSDGHASNKLSKIYSDSDISKINVILDWKAINAKYWINDEDLDMKRRKEAEFLIYGDIPYSCLDMFAVYDETAKAKLTNMGIEGDIVFVLPELYFDVK